ncbi:hypothetical protein [Niallia sp. 03190]|uniref:hypothetical protein n=1 Tax=Niallia sp. 03190 TaxID=3458061 RepID=UPI004043C7EA
MNRLITVLITLGSLILMYCLQFIFKSEFLSVTIVFAFLAAIIITLQIKILKFLKNK